MSMMRTYRTKLVCELCTRVRYRGSRQHILIDGPSTSVTCKCFKICHITYTALYTSFPSGMAIPKLQACHAPTPCCRGTAITQMPGVNRAWSDPPHHGQNGSWAKWKTGACGLYMQQNSTVYMTVIDFLLLLPLQAKQNMSDTSPQHVQLHCTRKKT